MTICSSPIGFEDGHIVSYSVSTERLELLFEYWNEQHGTLVFDGFIGLCDAGAIGVTVGSVCEVASSEFLSLLARRHFAIPPESLDWKHFRFLDVDDGAMFDIVARTCIIV